MKYQIKVTWPDGTVEYVEDDNHRRERFASRRAANERIAWLGIAKDPAKPVVAVVRCVMVKRRFKAAA